MAIVSLTLELHIEQAQSLKDRRQVVRSLKEKLRRGFNISIAEMDEAVTWQSATIGVTAISRSRDYLSGLMRQVEDAAVRIANDLGAQVADSWCSFLEEEAEEEVSKALSDNLRGLAKDFFHGGATGTKVPSGSRSGNAA